MPGTGSVNGEMGEPDEWGLAGAHGGWTDVPEGFIYRGLGRRMVINKTDEVIKPQEKKSITEEITTKKNK